MKKKKKKKVPTKIKEIISYLSYTFSNKLMSAEDLSQDLYLLYFTMLKTDKRAKKAKPGYFFLRFKWFLLTKFKREVNRKIKEWQYAWEHGLQDIARQSEIQSRIGYLSTLRHPFKKDR